MTRKADKGLEGKVVAKHGRQKEQRLKAYMVLQYLLKYSDENNPKSSYDIIGYLEGCGIPAERRSIYKDIEDINRIMLMLQEDIDLEEVDQMFAEAEESGDEEELNDLKTVLYDKNRKGFYVRQRKFELNDMRLLAECVYAAKFIAEGKAKQLLDVVCEFVSEEQARKIRHNAFLTDRVKTDNRGVMNNIAVINDAMSYHLDGEPHTPEKISFKYTKYTIGDMSKQVERRQGARYTVSPYQLLINDGNYYLLAFDDYAQDMRTYRVDRMKDLRFTGEARDGEEVFEKIDLKTYTKRVFSMYGGEQKLVEIRFINPLLDAVVDRFGTKDVQYGKVDDNHFSVTAKVEISDQFFGWLLGFGKKAKLLYPDDVIGEFKTYMDKIREMY
ncbi:MAG: WYL domain-containing protein [Oscillospiraceae bacterium]|nr:WYL domain-containing protein [Oscillospiraceae bacterium]